MIDDIKGVKLMRVAMIEKGGCTGVGQVVQPPGFISIM